MKPMGDGHGSIGLLQARFFWGGIQTLKSDQIKSQIKEPKEI